jgi:hypothetical protein
MQNTQRGNEKSVQNCGQLPEKKLQEGQRRRERMIFELILKRLGLMVLTEFTDLQESLVVGLVILIFHDFNSFWFGE